MTHDLFAGIPVRQVADHGDVYVKVSPEHAGHSLHLLFVGDLETRIASIAERGLQPARRETLANGVRRITFHDPDGNEISFGGAPPD